MTEVFLLALGTDIDFTLFLLRPQGAEISYSAIWDRKQKPKATPDAVAAMGLPVAVPLVYTAQKFVVDEDKGERSQ